MYPYSITVINLNHESSYVLSPMSPCSKSLNMGIALGIPTQATSEDQANLGLGCPWVKSSTLVPLIAYRGGRVESCLVSPAYGMV